MRGKLSEGGVKGSEGRESEAEGRWGDGNPR